MSKKGKHNVSVKRSDKSRSRARGDMGGYIWKMDKKLSALFLLVIFLIAIGFLWVLRELRTTQEAIEVKMSDEQAANMPLSDTEIGLNTHMSQEMSMNPVEVDGKPFSGYAVISFSTSVGPYAMYDGYLEEGLFNGQGSYTIYYPGTNTAKSIYTGEWTDSLPNGLGTNKFFYQGNGGLEFLCSGTWVDGQLSGPSCECTYFWPTGEIHFQYSGGVLDGQFSGTESEYTVYSPTGAVLFQYSGGFLDNMFNGSGTGMEYTEDGTVLKCVYKGTWKDNNRNVTGTATCYYEDGKTTKYIYEGEWKDNSPEGEGTSTAYYEDGKTIKWQHSSQWKNGFPDGKGTFTKYDMNGGGLTTGETDCTVDETGLTLDTYWDTSTADEATMYEFTDFITDIMDMTAYHEGE